MSSRTNASSLFPFFGTLVILLTSIGCHHNRRPSYPLGIYEAGASLNLQKISSAGFDLVTGPAKQKFLDAASSNRLQVLAFAGAFAGEFDRKVVTETIRLLDRHPALWAWYVVDEPDLKGLSPERVAVANQHFKRFAGKPTALVVMSGSEGLNYADIPDIMMVDRYPIPWMPLANFSQNVRLAKSATGKKKPLIAVIQAFDWKYYPELMPERTAFRPPSREEMRCMAYSALAEGANGIFFYCFDDRRWRMPDHPETWDALCDVVREIKERLPLFSALQPWADLQVSYAEYAEGWNEALQSSVTTTFLKVKRGNEKVRPGNYVLAVNTTRRELRFNLKLPAKSSQLQVFGENRRCELSGGAFNDRIEPYGIHVYGPFE